VSWELTDDVERFAATAGEFLRSRPVPHTTLLTLVDTLRRGLQTYGSDAPVFGWWRTPSGAVGGVLLHTPPHPMIFSEIPPEAIPAAVAAVAGRPPSAVNLLAGTAEVFAQQWRQCTGATATVSYQTRLHRLETLIPPAVPPPGAARPAGAGDRERLLRWFDAFFDDIDEDHPNTAESVDDRLAYDGVTLWESGGAPVSMAVRSRSTAGMIRVQYVYTPPELRGNGYAGAATAAATREALAAGARDVVLHTDLANPVSNRIYRKLGYQPVEDRTVVELA
jgi:GNAT superfamily N-acetyltransferase